MSRIIFLDRDGVINKVTKGKYLNKVEDLKYIDDSLTAIKLLKDAGFDIYVITNQAGVAYGYMTEEDLTKIHDRIMNDAEGCIKGILYCVHSKEANCDCRKPGSKLCEEVIEKYDDDEKEIWVVGDAETDIQMAINISAKSMLVLTGISKIEDVLNFKQLPSYVVNDLLTVAYMLEEHD